MSNGWKIFIVAAAGLLTCLLVAVGIYTAREGKASANDTTDAMNKTFSQYQDLDLSIYDGLSVSGSEITTLIKSVLGDENAYAAVVVHTNAGAVTHYNYTYTAAANATSSPTISETGATLTLSNEVPTAANYINPNGTFTGAIDRDANGTLIAVIFTQN